MLTWLISIVIILVVVGLFIGWRNRNRVHYEEPSHGDRWDRGLDDSGGPHDPLS